MNNHLSSNGILEVMVILQVNIYTVYKLTAYIHKI